MLLVIERSKGLRFLPLHGGWFSRRIKVSANCTTLSNPGCQMLQVAGWVSQANVSIVVKGFPTWNYAKANILSVRCSMSCLGFSI